MTQRYSLNMQGERDGEWVEYKDFAQLQLEFDDFKFHAEQRIEDLEYELEQIRNYQVGGV